MPIFDIRESSWPARWDNTRAKLLGLATIPSVGPNGPQRLLLSIFLSMAVCLSATASGPSIFPGDTIGIRLTDSLDTGKNRTGDRFQAVVDRDIESNGLVLIPKGTVVEGTLREVVSSGRLKRRAEMTLELNAVDVAGRQQPIEVEPEKRLGQSHGSHDGKFIGGGALFGLVVGALAGGGKGAAIGSMTGAAAGAGGAGVTGKAELHIPSETVMVFHLKTKFAPELP
jgi:hypothetical protein